MPLRTHFLVPLGCMHENPNGSLVYTVPDSVPTYYTPLERSGLVLHERTWLCRCVVASWPIARLARAFVTRTKPGLWPRLQLYTSAVCSTVPRAQCSWLEPGSRLRHRKCYPVLYSLAGEWMNEWIKKWMKQLMTNWKRAGNKEEKGTCSVKEEGKMRFVKLIKQWTIVSSLKLNAIRFAFVARRAADFFMHSFQPTIPNFLLGVSYL